MKPVYSLLLTIIGAFSAPVLPTVPILQWQLHDTGCFVHYNMATMAGTQGCQSGTEPPPPLSAWQPIALDTDAWASTCKAMGGTRIIYVAKHGCGFAAWRSKVAEYNYSVSNVPAGPAQVDVVEAFVRSARAAGLGVGFYYSDATNSYCNVRGGAVVPGGGKPGQMLVTQEQYDSFVVSHLTELWSNYGQLDEIWFDGGYHPTLKSTLQALLLKLQPNAVVFGGAGLTPNALRWIGTESGLAPYPTWSTTAPGDNGQGSPSGVDWTPAETDFTLQNGDNWFYSETSGVHTTKELRQMYEQSSGSNTGLIIDMAPFPNGSLPAAQVAAATALGHFVRDCYEQPPLASGKGSWNITITPNGLRGIAEIDRVQIREDQSQGQRVRNFTLSAVDNHGEQISSLCHQRGGSSIGNKYICVLPNPIRISSLTLEVTSAIDTPTITQFAAFSCNNLAQQIESTS